VASDPGATTVELIAEMVYWHSNIFNKMIS